MNKMVAYQLSYIQRIVLSEVIRTLIYTYIVVYAYMQCTYISSYCMDWLLGASTLSAYLLLSAYFCQGFRHVEIEVLVCVCWFSVNGCVNGSLRVPC